MENKYQYFKRDISWLSFNYRVLLEADDDRLPLYERINFISIYSSNLEEFYKIRVADHKAVASGVTDGTEESLQSAKELLEEINREVKKDHTCITQKSRCLLSKPQCRAFPPTIRKRLFPGRDIPLPTTGTGIQRQSNLFSARQPALPGSSPVPERYKQRRC